MSEKQEVQAGNVDDRPIQGTGLTRITMGNPKGKYRLAASSPQGNSSSTHYTRMARYYDTLYSKIVDYPSQVDYLEKILAKHRRKRPESILDVACGTGNYTFLFAKRGYRATGIDISDEMVRIARTKAGRKQNPLFFKMDMRKIGLQAKYDVAVVLFGGFGYLLEQSGVGEFFASVAKQLNRGGLLIFEFWQNSAILPAATRPSGQKTWNRVEDSKRLIIRLNTSKYDAHTNILTVTFDFYVLETRTKRLVDSF